MPNDRRITDTPLLDTARILAILYTLGFFGMVSAMLFKGIPTENRDAINQLIGALTIIQTGIIGFYFGGSKANDAAQTQAAISRERTDTALTEIAKAVPVLAVPSAPVVTPAPATPDGTIPAAAVVDKPEVKP